MSSEETPDPIVPLAREVRDRASALFVGREGEPGFPDALRRWVEVSLLDVQQRLQVIVDGVVEAGPG